MGLAQNVLVEIVQGNGALEQIAMSVKSAKKPVVNAIQKLKRRGLIDIPSRGKYTPTAEGTAWVNSGKEIKSGQLSRRPRTATRGMRQRAWWVFRARKIATLPELLSTLADGSQKGANGNLTSYVGILVRAGFLSALPGRTQGTALTSSGHRRYQLIRDNGRLAPVVRQTDRVVYDPNTGEVFPYRKKS